jgi:subtilisin family serine protease
MVDLRHGPKIASPGGHGCRPARSWSRRIAMVATVALAAVATTLPSIAASSEATPRASADRAVIVQARPGRALAVAGALTNLGGSIRAPLSIINGFSASVPAAAVGLLRRDPDVLAVTPNAHLRGMGSSYDPSGDVNSMKSTADYLGASAWWDAGYTGKGVDVALIDSGVVRVNGLRSAGKVFFGPDLSRESQDPSLHNLDSFGHGTFMAGLIAGHDDALSQPYSQAPASQYRGIAPDARLISIKVATADGGTDVSEIIAAIDWVVQHRDDPGFNMRVINLSYGTNSLQPYLLDPLAYAAEVAWHYGIVVVAAAGNSGYQKSVGAPGLADPAYDPYVMATGASASSGTPSTADDVVSAFSARGCGILCRDPEVVAPGTSIQGLRDPGSYIDSKYKKGRLGKRYFRGSGTSEATAVLSGAVALVLQKYPSLSPDEVKRFFTDHASQLLGFDHESQGSGEIDLATMLDATPQPYHQSHLPSTGLGLLELSRGSDHLTSNGVVLAGEVDLFGKGVVTRVLALLESLGISWTGGVWNTSVWAGEGWTGDAWDAVQWIGTDWAGVDWSSGPWSSKSWSGKSWSSGEWSSKSWSGSDWSGKSWSSASWG